MLLFQYAFQMDGAGSRGFWEFLLKKTMYPPHFSKGSLDMRDTRAIFCFPWSHLHPVHGEHTNRKDLVITFREAEYHLAIPKRTQIRETNVILAKVSSAFVSRSQFPMVEESLEILHTPLSTFHMNYHEVSPKGYSFPTYHYFPGICYDDEPANRMWFFHKYFAQRLMRMGHVASHMVHPPSDGKG